MSHRDTGVAFVLTALAAGCSGLPWWQSTLDTWRGAPLREVLVVWGPPSQDEVTGERRVLLYELTTEVDERAQESYELARAADPSGSREAPPSELVCKTWFELERDVVTKVYARGAGCDPQRRPESGS